MTVAGRPECSVIIVNCNGGDWVLRCVGSVRERHSRERVEIVVVDNASTDGSREQIRKRFSPPDVKLVENDRNTGFGAACNTGVRNSEGHTLLFLNSDCEFVEDTLAPLTATLQDRADIGILFCKLLNSDGSLQPSVNRRFPSRTSSFLEPLGWSTWKHRLFRSKRLGSVALGSVREWHASTHAVAWGGGNLMFMRRSVFESLGGFDEGFFMYFEDIDLCRRAGELGLKCWYQPVPAVIHHWAKSKPTEGISPLQENYRSRLHYFEKHYGKGWARAIRVSTVIEALTRCAAFAGLGMVDGRRWGRQAAGYRSVVRHLLR